MLSNPSDIDILYRIKRVVFYKNGIVVERAARYPMDRKPPTARKGVYDMSKKSRLRLTHIVANCEVKFVSMFTLTYGDFFIPINGPELKRQINIILGNFRKRFECEYIWFLEFTKKDRPHLHVISTVMPNDFDRAWLGHRWAKITVYDYFKRVTAGKLGKDYTPTHLIDGWIVTEEMKKVASVHSHPKCWEKIRKNDGAARYCLKYATKEEQKLVPVGFSDVGRFWGTSRNVAPKPIGELLIGETMSEEEFKAKMLDTRVGMYPLIPHYVFEQDALEYFKTRGIKLTELYDVSKAFKVAQNLENVVNSEY